MITETQQRNEREDSNLGNTCELIGILECIPEGTHVSSVIGSYRNGVDLYNKKKVVEASEKYLRELVRSRVVPPRNYRVKITLSKV